MINPITKKVFLGEFEDVNLKNLRKHKIDLVLNVNNEPDSAESQLLSKTEIRYWSYSIPQKETETSEAFNKDILTAARLLERAIALSFEHILVHCQVGIDRSPAVVAQYLCNVAHLYPEQAYALIKKQRKCILEHFDWLTVV